MTEPAQPCIRGCVRPCDCQECVSSDRPVHPPAPRPATRGLLCTRDETRLWAWLDEIVVLYATLDTGLKDNGERAGNAHTKLSGSPALVDLSVVALMDPRTSMGDGTMHVPSAVASWALMVTEERQLAGPCGTLTEAVGVLTAHFEWVCSAAWVDEMWAELKDVRAALGRAHGEQRPKMVGRCLTVHDADGEARSCGRRLYLPPGGEKLRCGACGRAYSGMDLVRVKVQDEREKVA